MMVDLWSLVGFVRIQEVATSKGDPDEDLWSKCICLVD